jgi:steroid 5-alpha reductase family enzyme
MGHFFNLVNAYLQARYLFTLGPQQGVEWLADSRFLSGLAVFAAGFCINLHSDHVLRNLRGAADSGYKVPHRGMFRFVSCPNYLGEIVEWCGWALMTWSLPGLAFALWTAANLAPRARSHHRWYVKTFPDYPAGRRALVPFLW